MAQLESEASMPFGSSLDDSWANVVTRPGPENAPGAQTLCACARDVAEVV